MTSLGRLIYFDQLGTGASDPITLGAMPTLEQWADSITAVLDDLGSAAKRSSLRSTAAFAPAALFAATHPSRTTALVVLEGYADPLAERTEGCDPEETRRCHVAMWGTGEFDASHESGHAVERGDSGDLGTARNAWRQAQGLSPFILTLMAELNVRPLLPTIRVPTLVVHHTDDQINPACDGQVHRRSHIGCEIR